MKCIHFCNLCTDEAGSTTGSFNPGENLPKEFMHLKSHIKEYLNGSKHVGNWKKFLEQEERNKVLERRRVQIGTRIGRLCYSVYQEGKWKISFEKNIV